MDVSKSSTANAVGLFCGLYFPKGPVYNDKNSTNGGSNMIRMAEKRDIPGVAAIYDHILTEQEQGKCSVGWQRGVYPTEQTAEEALALGELFVEELEGKIVAAAKINQTQVPEYADAPWEYSAPDREVMVLHTLVVDPGCAGKGSGRRFVQFYEEYAAANGCRYLRMDTNEINTAARGLYRKLGYREVGIVDCEFNGIPGVHLVCLEKYLGE